MGEDEYEEVIEDDRKYKIKMDDDKKLTAFFAKVDEYFEFEMEEDSFQDAEGEAHDLTDNAPYPPGYEVHLKAEPETMDDTFSHWEVKIEVKTEDGNIETIEADPTDYFDDYESEWASFKVPREEPTEFETQTFSGEFYDMIERVLIVPFFKTAAPDDIEYNHEDFYNVKRGGYGLESNDWDVSYVEDGEEIDFHFNAMSIPDRFRIFYGGEMEFDSKWASHNPDRYRDDDRYAGVPVQSHKENNRVTASDIVNGGKLTFEKEEGHDRVRVVVTNRDSGTAWRYALGAELDVQFTLFAEYSDGSFMQISEEELTDESNNPNERLMEISEEELTDESENPKVKIKATSDGGEPEMPRLVLAAIGPEDLDIGVNNLNIDFNETWVSEVWDPDEGEMVDKEFNIRHNENSSWENIDASEFYQLPDDIEDDVRLWGIEDLALCGGEANFRVDINNYTQEFTFEIKGENPGEETVLDYTGEKASDDLWYAEAIASQESIGGNQFVDEDTPGYVMLNEKGVTLVGYPDGWGVMQLEEHARNAAAGNDKEMAWHWQKNVDGGINWMENQRSTAERFINSLNLSVPRERKIDRYPFEKPFTDPEDIIAIQLYNGVADVPFQMVYDSTSTDEGYETYGHVDELSDDKENRLTRVSRIAFEFDWDSYYEGDYEENKDLWNFHSNDKGYVEEVIKEYDEMN